MYDLFIYAGTRCTDQVTVTVTSDCTPAVLGVTLTSTEPIEVSSSAPGTYEVVACSIPVDIHFERIGYSPVTQTITNSSTTVSLSCVGKACYMYLLRIKGVCIQAHERISSCSRRSSSPHITTYCHYRETLINTSQGFRYRCASEILNTHS